jgi:hypothetical protein
MNAYNIIINYNMNQIGVNVAINFIICLKFLEKFLKYMRNDVKLLKSLD